LRLSLPDALGRTNDNGAQRHFGARTVFDRPIEREDKFFEFSQATASL
jgi:hypothetical protein